MNGKKKELTIEITEQIKKDLDLFKGRMGYECNLNNPQTHAEHVMRKKYCDRNPLLTITSDKIKVREYIRERLGSEDIVKIKFETYDIETAIKNINPPCVVKINNASGRNLFIKDNNFDVGVIRGKLYKWMNSKYGGDKGEWGYYNIKPGIVIEPLLFEGDHLIYRFLTFDGIVKYIHAHRYAFKKIDGKIIGTFVKSCSTYDTKWNHIKVQYKTSPNEIEEKPSNLEEMIEIAEKLGKGLDFVRVDLLNTEHGIVFSEMTHYPVSGKCKFTPQSFDEELGSFWNKDHEIYYVWFEDKLGKFKALKNTMIYSFQKYNQIKISGKKLSYPKINKKEKSSHEENIYKLKFWKNKILNSNNPVLLIDCDLLFLDNISEIFNTDYDIVLTSRDYSETKYNAGVIYFDSNNKTKEFISEWYRLSKEEFDINNPIWKSILKRAKGATQSTLTYMIENNKTFGCKIGYLPCKIWNCAGSDFDKFSKDTKILHIKSELRQLIFEEKIKNNNYIRILTFLKQLWKKYEMEATNV